MKIFSEREIFAAYDHADAGGQALHVHGMSQGHRLFARYAEIGHLIDNNKERLVTTAKQLGVRVIKVERVGRRGQHIDLCGKPFEKAKEMCEQPSLL